MLKLEVTFRFLSAPVVYQAQLLGTVCREKSNIACPELLVASSAHYSPFWGNSLRGSLMVKIVLLYIYIRLIGVYPFHSEADRIISTIFPHIRDSLE